MKNDLPGLDQHLAQWSTNMNDLWVVTRVAMVCMMATLIIGTWYEGAFVKRKAELVACSADINNMARKLNVTLLGECMVQR